MRGLGHKERLARLWPHLRLVFILYHLGAVVLYALPPPQEIDRPETWKKPSRQHALRSWSNFFAELGLEVSPAALEEAALSFGLKYVPLREAILRPFRPYVTYTGTRQGWLMFSRPQMKPAQLVIEISREGGDWEILYIRNSDRYAWRAAQFNHNRLRKLHGRLPRDSHRAAFEDLAQWIGRRAAEEFPDHTKVRVRLFRVETLSPEATRRGDEPETSVIRNRTLSLAGLR